MTNYIYKQKYLKYKNNNQKRLKIKSHAEKTLIRESK